MDLVRLDDSDLDEIETLFTRFHSGYASFFQTKTRSVAKPASDYLQGQLFTKQSMNLAQFCREVPDSEYESMQHFISNSPWQDAQLKPQLVSDVVHLLGDPTDGALIVDESGIPKSGSMSVGVERQYCGRLGKVDNCQVGVYLAYANGHGASLIDFRLYLPQSWVDDDARREKCGVPKPITFQTKAQLGLEMINAFKQKGFPFSFVSFDAHYGQQPWMLKQLTNQDIIYIADVPCDILCIARNCAFG